MTCIVALKDRENDCIVMGGDSAGMDRSYNLRIRADEKVFIRGPFLIGFTGSFRAGQLLRFSLKVPEQTVYQSDYEYMCTTFVDAIRDCWKKGGYLQKNNEVERGGTFLVGYNRELYDVQCDHQVGKYPESAPYAAVGCGESYALGALYVNYDSLDPEEVVRAALTAAEEFSGGVRSPFIILRGGEKVEPTVLLGVAG